MVRTESECFSTGASISNILVFDLRPYWAGVHVHQRLTSASLANLQPFGLLSLPITLAAS